MQQKADVNTQDRSNTLLRLHVTCQSINSRQIKWYVQYAGLCTLSATTSTTYFNAESLKAWTTYYTLKYTLQFPTARHTQDLTSSDTTSSYNTKRWSNCKAHPMSTLQKLMSQQQIYW